MSDWSIHPIARNEIESAGTVLAEAFQDDPLMRFLSPDESRRRRWLPVLQSGMVELAQPDGHTYAVRDGAGEVAGVVCLGPPGRWPPGPHRNLRLVARIMLRPTAPPPQLRYLLRGARYAMPLARLHPKTPHWYVAVIGVCPRFQGRGAGRALLDRAVALAEAASLPLYLETQSQKNVGFYESAGFEVLKHLWPHPDGPASWTMLRRPSQEDVSIGE